MELRGLVSELDEKLAPSRPADPVIIPDDEPNPVKQWVGFAALGFAAGLFIVIMIGLFAARPWESSCAAGDHMCEIAELDIDALRVAIPNSELIAVLTDIDALDPNDELTAGDVFEMERFAGIDFESLLTEDDIELLLGAAR